VDLGDILADAYGVHVCRSAPAPHGFTGRAWVLDTGGGPLVARLSPGGESADRSAVLLEALADQVGRVPQLMRNVAGQQTTPVNGQVLTVLAFIDGRTPEHWPAWPSQVLADLGRLVAAIHVRTATLPPPPVQRDPFDCSAAALLPATLAALAAPGTDANRRAAINSVLAHRRELDTQVRRLDQLSHAARRRAADRLVLCHTDVAGDNIVVHNGDVYLLDWDEAALAPAEADLLLAARDQRDAHPLRDFLTGYRDVRPELVVDRDVLAFLLLRRALEDAAARVALLADSSRTDSAQQGAAEDFLVCVVAVWRQQDTTISLAAASA
jgi:spectinomycin phosphotransferase